MGWGTTKGTKPQPTSGAPDPDVMSKSRMKRLATHLAEDDLVVVADPPSSTAKAEAAWGQFRSRKGWVPDTVAMILYEFVRERGLFDDLIAFAKKRK